MRLLFIIFFIVFSLQSIAQNLVPNGEFDKFKYCPYGFTLDRLTIVPNWRQPTMGTADYFNECSQTYGVPNNPMGTQSAVMGPGYIGLVAFAPNEYNTREYIQVKLTEPLVAGQTYCISFLVSLADYSNYMIDGFGVLFSQRVIKGNGKKNLHFKPQVQVPSGYLLQDEIDWMEISEVYKAEGGEKYLTFGNFKSDNELLVKFRNIHIEKPNHSWDFAYYYLDHVSLVEINKEDKCFDGISRMKEQLESGEKPEPPMIAEIALKKILFDFDQSLLSDEAIDQLNDILNIMLQSKSYKLEMIGHTDSYGRDGYNMELSEERASIVIEYLASRGIDRSRLSMTWKGENEPTSKNNTSVGRHENRRVEFRVFEFSYEDFKFPVISQE
jgi:outer membrane protein OmpA-like peptidoglycan-associated protein